MEDVAHEAPGPHDLHDLDYKELKKLKTSSSEIRSLAVLLCLTVVVLLAIGAARLTAGSPERTVSGFLFLSLGTFYAVVAILLFKRTRMGRTLALLGTVPMFATALAPSLLGPLIGLIVLVRLGRAARLFGPDRITHERLVAELAHRKRSGLKV